LEKYEESLFRVEETISINIKSELYPEKSVNIYCTGAIRQKTGILIAVEF
jgi:hypothetical protein